jgi:hypothetical protein
MNIQKIAERVAVVNTRRALFGKLGCRLATRRQHRTGEDGASEIVARRAMPICGFESLIRRQRITPPAARLSQPASGFPGKLSSDIKKLKPFGSAGFLSFRNTKALKSGAQVKAASAGRTTRQPPVPFAPVRPTPYNQTHGTLARHRLQIPLLAR